MWSVTRPTMNASAVFQTCANGLRDTGLRHRLLSILPDIAGAALDYETRATSSDLHLIPTATSIGGAVTRDEMVRLYEQRMARRDSPGRPVYDQLKLLPEGDRCPFCDQRRVSTLDHILPKALYPALAVLPINLVGACMECNKAKHVTAPTTPGEVALHPYFEDISRDLWLCAQVIHQHPAAVIFYVSPAPGWSRALTERVRSHFELYGLSTLYSSEAAREISNIRKNLQTYFDIDGADAVRSELLRQWGSRRANRLNSWQTATYEALSHDTWFYSCGFAL
jgi:hypothetical protein